MTRKKWFLGMLVMVLTFSFMAAGCASAPKESPKETPTALGPKLQESLRKYMGANPQMRGNDDNREKVDVYFLDPLHFEAFKAELDAGDEYYQTGSWANDNRDWDRGKTFARWAVWPDGRGELDLCKEDNSVIGYRYAKGIQETGFIKPDTDGWVRYFNNDESVKSLQRGEVFENPNADPNVYEMELKTTSGNENNGYGMFFGAKDGQNGYAIFLRPIGTFDTWKMVNGRFDTIHHTLGAGQVKSGHNVINTIKAVKNGNGYDIYLNGSAAPVYTLNDTSIDGNKIGYMVMLPRPGRPIEAFLKVKPPKEALVTLGLTLEESLRKYMGPSPQIWGDDDKRENVDIYYLDPLHFDAFKAELDAVGEYTQTDAWTENRTWEQGKTFARFAVQPNGRFQLDLCKEDNSVTGYRYESR